MLVFIYTNQSSSSHLPVYSVPLLFCFSAESTADNDVDTMGAFTKRKLSNSHIPEDERPQVEMANRQSVGQDEQKVTALALAAGFTASLGGLIFGYVRFVDALPPRSEFEI